MGLLGMMQGKMAAVDYVVLLVYISATLALGMAVGRKSGAVVTTFSPVAASPGG